MNFITAFACMQNCFCCGNSHHPAPCLPLHSHGLTGLIFQTSNFKLKQGLPVEPAGAKPFIQLSLVQHYPKLFFIGTFFGYSCVSHRPSTSFVLRFAGVVLQKTRDGVTN
jgi:hypothetical protein